MGGPGVLLGTGRARPGDGGAGPGWGGRANETRDAESVRGPRRGWQRARPGRPVHSLSDEPRRVRGDEPGVRKLLPRWSARADHRRGLTAAAGCAGGDRRDRDDLRGWV